MTRGLFCLLAPDVLRTSRSGSSPNLTFLGNAVVSRERVWTREPSRGASRGHIFISEFGHETRHARGGYHGLWFGPFKLQLSQKNQDLQAFKVKNTQSSLAQQTPLRGGRLLKYTKNFVKTTLRVGVQQSASLSNCLEPYTIKYRLRVKRTARRSVIRLQHKIGIPLPPRSGEEVSSLSK